MFKTQFLLLFFSCSWALFGINKSDYVAPKTIQYPFGDEVYNADLKDDRVQEEFRPVETEVIKDIYTFCPNATEDEDELTYSEVPYSDTLCSKCDVRPTVDKRGALVECYNCSDEGSSMFTTSSEEVAPEHILFLTTFIEISNYTVPKNL